MPAAAAAVDDTAVSNAAAVRAVPAAVRAVPAAVPAIMRAVAPESQPKPPADPPLPPATAAGPQPNLSHSYVGGADRIALVQRGYNATSHEAILGTVARDLQMRSDRVIHIRDREPLPVSGVSLGLSSSVNMRNTDRLAPNNFLSEADAFAEAALNRGGPIRKFVQNSNHVVPAAAVRTVAAAGMPPMEHNSAPYFQAKADKLAEDHVRTHQPVRTSWEKESAHNFRAKADKIAQDHARTHQPVRASWNDAAPTSPPQPLARAELEQLQVGSRVKVCDLHAKPEFNDQAGTIHSLLENGRIGVLLDSDKEAIVSLKPANLIFLAPTSASQNQPAASEEESLTELLENKKAELAKRMEKAGAKQGAMNVSLMWTNNSGKGCDLDLYVETPKGRISYSNKAMGNGKLDVDRRASAGDMVENVFWTKPDVGKYHVYVRNCDRSSLKNSGGTMPFTVILKTDNSISLLDAEGKTTVPNFVGVKSFDHEFIGGMESIPVCYFEVKEEEHVQVCTTLASSEQCACAHAKHQAHEQKHRGRVNSSIMHAYLCTALGFSRGRNSFAADCNAWQVSSALQGVSLSDVDDGVWGLGLYDMPDDWGATGIKFWGSPKKELRITGFLQGLPFEPTIRTYRPELTGPLNQPSELTGP